jgi:hypothetical protein
MRGRPNSHHFVMNGFQNTTSLPDTDVLRDLYNADGSITLLHFYPSKIMCFWEDIPM